MFRVGLVIMVVLVGNIAAADQVTESRLSKLYKHIKKQRETKHEGQVKGTGGKDDSIISVKPTKKIFIVSSVDNKTIIETIKTEEDKQEFIKRSRIKKKRLRSKAVKEGLGPSGLKRGTKLEKHYTEETKIANEKMPENPEKLLRKRKVKPAEAVISPEMWLDRFYTNNSLKKKNKIKSRKASSRKKNVTGQVESRVIQIEEPVKTETSENPTASFSELMLKPLIIYSKQNYLLDSENANLPLTIPSVKKMNSFDVRKLDRQQLSFGAEKLNVKNFDTFRDKNMDEHKLETIDVESLDEPKKVNPLKLDKHNLKIYKAEVFKDISLPGTKKEDAKGTQIKVKQFQFKTTPHSKKPMKKIDKTKADAVPNQLKDDLTRSTFESLMLKPQKFSKNNSSATESEAKKKTWRSSSKIKLGKGSMLPMTRFEHFPVAKKEGENTNETKNSKKKNKRILLQPILANLLESHENEENVEKITDTERQIIINNLIDLKEKVDGQIYNGLQLKKQKASSKKIPDQKLKTISEASPREAKSGFKPSFSQYNNWTPIFDPSEKVTSNVGRESRSLEQSKSEVKAQELRLEILEMKNQILTEINDIQTATLPQPGPIPKATLKRKKKFTKRMKKGKFSLFKNVKSLLGKTSKWFRF